MEDFKFESVTKIEKCIGEYNIWETEKTPYAKFKIKVYVNGNSAYAGYTNLQVKDALGDYYSAVGYGATEKEALEDTLQQFFKMLERKDEWNEEDFCCSESYDF
ncbi:MAG: hypothetical protein E7195_02135 [Peptococcaceae bacterium]|nr:hypothetical protein [Peptococcaceae bacterium]MBR2626813.1 hypothetical protein [Peptococcaceae bacterium]